MFFEDDEREYKLVAPDVDQLIRYFYNRYLNPILSTPALLSATDLLWDALEPVAVLPKNDEAKSIWIRVPRGKIEDFETFENAKEYYDEVKTYEDYEKLWLYEYPTELKWYRLVVVKSIDPRTGELGYYGVSLGNEMIISASIEQRCLDDGKYYAEEAACKLCEIILPAVKESVDLLKAGKYNDLIEAELPYQFRKGVIRRSELWEYDPEYRKYTYDGLSEEAVQQFKSLIASGINDEAKIGRIKNFTANDFFKACKIGYEAIGKDCSGFSLPDLYMHYADGRDEGLTGQGHGLNAGPGIDFDSPEAWNEWFFNRPQHGGHPWEVVPGGNSTHVELYVKNDKRELEWDLRSGKISQKEFDEKISAAGYYFAIAGIQRQFEAVSFYNALSAAGLPVVIGGAEELIARFEATDWIGIVPHHVPTRYCEDLFPNEYGEIIDFTHVYKEDDPWFEKIKWLPEDPAKLVEMEQ